MSEELQEIREVREIRERQVACETRLAALERATDGVAAELRKLSTLLRGNGEDGLFAQVRLQEERLRTLQRQWVWILGLLTAVVIAVLRKEVMG